MSSAMSNIKLSEISIQLQLRARHWHFPKNPKENLRKTVVLAYRLHGEKFLHLCPGDGSTCVGKDLKKSDLTAVSLEEKSSTYTKHCLSPTAAGVCGIENKKTTNILRPNNFFLFVNTVKSAMQ